MFEKEKSGAFIVPTGIGASIGGYAGDASVWARKFAEFSRLIVNPNVVNAGCFSGITDNMLYVEGYTLNEFFKGNVALEPVIQNKVGVVFDKGISQNVLNIHINTINAVKTVYGIDIIYAVTDEPVGVDFFIDESGISTGKVNNIETLLQTAKNLLEKGADAIGIVCKFNEDIQNPDYENGVGVDPIGGGEAIISHYLSKELMVSVAHSPAFDDFSISTDIVNPKASAEYITPTFLPCILIGLSQAPKIKGTGNREEDKMRGCVKAWQNHSPIHPFTHSTLEIQNLEFLVMPYNSLGSVPVFEAIKRGIKVFAVKENSTVLNVTKQTLKLDNVIEVDTYQECLELVKNL